MERTISSASWTCSVLNPKASRILVLVNFSATLRAAALGLLLGATACKPKPSTQQPEAPSPDATTADAPASPFHKSPQPNRAVNPASPPAALWKEFSGEKAFAHVRKQVEIGPRPSGSSAIEKTRALLIETLTKSGWEIEPQTFTDQTPRGPIKFVNLIARFPTTNTKPALASTQQAIVCSHYDTKRFSTIQFVGASDAASSTGALLELARVLALQPELAAKVELVFFDGEEALAQFTETDGLYGSRFYARMLRETKRVGQFKFAILWDMIGDKDLTITLPPDSPQPLAQEILAAAESLGIRSHFSYYDRPIWDDHVPLNQLNIPTINLIDFNYLPWHTADDTLDKLSPASLQKIGALTLFHLQKALGK